MLGISTVHSIPNVYMCNFTHTGRVGREEDSLFVYRGSDTYSSVNNDTSFTPRFGVDLDNIPEDVKNACGGNRQCSYDLVQTGDVGLAESTASEEMELQNTRNILGMCTIPNVPLCTLCYCASSDNCLLLPP